MSLAFAVMALPGCGGDDDGNGDGGGEGEAPSGPAVVSGQIVLNGEPVRPNITSTAGGANPRAALLPKPLPKGKKVTIRETARDGSFTFTDVEPGTYELAADATWNLTASAIPAGTNLGPGQDRPCRAKGYSVSNTTLQIASAVFVELDARSKPALEIKPGDDLNLTVEFDCDIRRSQG